MRTITGMALMWAMILVGAGFVAAQDTTPPTVAIIAPANGSTVISGTTVVIMVSANDDSGIVSTVMIHAAEIIFGTSKPVRGSIKVLCKLTAPPPWACVWRPNLPGSASSALVLLDATAQDSSGNIASSASISVTLVP